MAFSGYLRQSTAATLKLGPFVDETDGKTAETALTLSQADIRLSKNGGDMAQKNEATTCTHDEIGIYDCPVNTTDTNTIGILDVFVHESGALPIRQNYVVLPDSSWVAQFISTGNGLMATGTAQSGASGNIQLASASSFGDDIPNGWLVVIVSGTGVGQARVITDYANATDTATITPAWGTAPDSTSVYVLFAGVPGLSSTELANATADAVWDEASTDHQTAGTTGAIQHGLSSGATVVDANIVKINDTSVDGAGTPGNPWGPV